MTESGTNSYTVETNSAPHSWANPGQTSTNTTRDHLPSNQEDPLLKLLKKQRNPHRRTKQEILTIISETHRSLFNHHHSLPHQTPSNQDNTHLSPREALKRHQQSTLARIYLGRNNPDLQPWLLRLPPYPTPQPNQDPQEDQLQPLQQSTPMQSRKYKTPSTQPSAELEEAEVEEILEEGEEEAVLDLPPEALEELNKFLQDRLRFRRQQTSELWAPHPDSSREKETSPKTGSTN